MTETTDTGESLRFRERYRSLPDDDLARLALFLKGTSDGPAYVAPFPRSQFIEIHPAGANQETRVTFEKFVKDISNLVLQFERRR